MDRLLTFITGPGDSRIGGGDSFTDRLNSRHTVFFLGILALVLTTLQWLGSVPIACFCPAHFEDSHVDFTNRACWTQNTYYLPISSHRIPKKNKAYISYYQWVALGLITQAVLFYVPRPLWQVLSKKSGISVTTITDASIQLQNTMHPKDREAIRKYLVNHMGRFLLDLSRRQLVANKLKTIFISLYGNYLIIAYCCIKMLYISNAIGQIIALNHFLDAKSYMYGLTVIDKMMKGEDWSTPERFPRITLCDIHIRRPGNIHNYTVQCSLPLNLFNEIIYIAVWFWIVAVGIVTVCSLIQWIYLSMFISMQVKYVTARLIALSAFSPGDDDNIVDCFVRKYLRRDGLFIIQMVAKNCSDIIAATIITGLFQHYKESRPRLMRLSTRDEYRLKKKELKMGLNQDINQCNKSLFSPDPVKPDPFESGRVSFEDDLKAGESADAEISQLKPSASGVSSAGDSSLTQSKSADTETSWLSELSEQQQAADEPTDMYGNPVKNSKDKDESNEHSHKSEVSDMSSSKTGLHAVRLHQPQGANKDKRNKGRQKFGNY